MEIRHETLVLERAFKAPPAKLFQAFKDPRQREIWSAPSPDTEVRIDDSDFRTGGRETGRCGSKGDLNWTMKVVYHRIVDDRLITFTEELWDADQLLTVALITFDIMPSDDGGTALCLTDQITSFVGAGGIAGHREGYEKAIRNLSDALLPA